MKYYVKILLVNNKPIPLFTVDCDMVDPGWPFVRYTGVECFITLYSAPGNFNGISCCLWYI